MTGKTNAGGGEAFAVIEAIYPAGAVCTCGMGDKILVAENSDGRFMFNIPKAGEWTVTARDGDRLASQTLEIQEGRAYFVELMFSLVLFDNGEDNTEITGGWTNVSGDRVSCTASTYSAGTGETEGTSSSGTKNAVDLTEFSTLKFYNAVSSHSGASVGQAWFGVSGAETRLEKSSAEELSVDISAVTGAKTIYVRTITWSNDGASSHSGSFTKAELIP